MYEDLQGNAGLLLKFLVATWTLAAFGEESMRNQSMSILRG